LQLGGGGSVMPARKWATQLNKWVCDPISAKLVQIGRRGVQHTIYLDTEKKNPTHHNDKRSRSKRRPRAIHWNTTT